MFYLQERRPLRRLLPLHETSKKVRVYTDATTYSYRATSVDWKAEKNNGQPYLLLSNAC
ncbi:protein of unknown function [Bacillus velezensis UCMB5113]|nr:protein of unknown function [Bacillus velezensis UCMB5113]